jgi:hypothetical protein
MIVDVEVLSCEDGAVVGGHRAVQLLREQGAICNGMIDIVLDMSALSLGISLPIARYLFEASGAVGSGVNLHIMVASHPQLDAAILSVPSDVVDPIRGFSGGIDLAESDQDPKIWLPHLAPGRTSALQLIRDKLQGPVSVCPVLPLSQRDPRAADRLIAEFESELYQDWEVDPRNLVYAIEDDPLDVYRTITAIYRRYTNERTSAISPTAVMSGWRGTVGARLSLRSPASGVAWSGPASATNCRSKSHLRTSTLAEQDGARYLRPSCQPSQ